MSVETDTDRMEFLADFGVDVEISGMTYTGILDNEWQDQSGISVTIPVLTMRTSDIVGVSRSQVVYVGEDSVKYTVQELMPDGQGITMLVLQAE